MKPYAEFLQDKFKFSQAFGFDVDDADINDKLKPHQRDIVKWAIKKGRAAIFAAFGLGKTFMQIEIQSAIFARESGRHLIILPLGVRQEFKADSEKLGYGRDMYQFVQSTDQVGDAGFYLTNYESVREGKLDIDLFTSVSLDEASVLRSYGSKTYQEFLPLFSDVKYRFVATATPSPNRYKELIHYAGFLGVMDTGQALTRFFKRDSSQAGNLQLHPHKEDEFHLWLHSWAIFIQKPSDLGYSDEGYDLPPMQVHYHEVQARDLGGKVDRDGQVQLINDAALGLKDAADEKRGSIDARIAKMKEIINQDPDSHYILWHDLEAERHAIRKALPEAVEVFGNLDLDIREQRIIDFSDGRFKYLATKPELSGSGCNFQRHCHKAIFVGIGYKFNDFIQAIHRIYRFLQEFGVEIHIIFSETEREVLATLQQKWEQDKQMRARMSELIRKYGLSTTGIETELARTVGVVRREAKGKHFHVANNDCVDETRLIKSDSIGLICTSIPFSNHYEYTPSYNDFGHTENNRHFWQQMDYLTPELLRVLMPGRLACIHVKDRVMFGNVTGKGVPTISTFHAEAIAHYAGMEPMHIAGHGFDYLGMITIVTDVVRENNQTYRLGWTEQCKDGSKMGVGSPEYILLFRKPQSDRSRSYADNPIVKSKEDYSRARWQVDAHAFWRSSGNRYLTADEMLGYGPDVLAKMFTQYSLDRIYNYEEHIKLGETMDDANSLPSTFMSIAPGSHADEVWHDVNRMFTLNGEQTQRGLNNHICPLQFDIVDRIINRYSNKGEEVYDPFGGLMTTPVRAIKAGRYGRAAELNTGYFLDGVNHLKGIEREIGMPTLFDFEENKEVAA